MAPGEASVAEAGPHVNKVFDLVLEPESHPALGPIRVEDSLFAIGRTEPPFASFEAGATAQLSRRHARIFIEDGAVYAADLGSKNGTTVNGAALREKPVRLNGGDVISFGGKLSFRVRMEPRSAPRAPARRIAHMTLTPERSDLGLQPVEVMQFPFLISKADETFAQYSDRYPHQVNYVSRRHAHIFMKGGVPFVEDLGSTNGTFVDGKRLDEAAVPLADGSSLAFGGNHFAYTVSLASSSEPNPTATATVPPTSAPAACAAFEAADSDKTTFITTAHSFLDIFCVDQGQQRDDEINRETLPVERPPARGRFARLAADLGAAFGGGKTSARRVFLFAIAFVAAIVAIGGALYLNGAAERNLKGLVDKGDYRDAVSVANAYLRSDPNNPQATALGTEALLKGYLPDWIHQLHNHDFDASNSALAQMKTLSATNLDARFLVDEIDWIGRLEMFMTGREHADAPIRIFADEDRMSALLKQWDSDPSGHQRRLDRIASTVPQFRELYAVALSHLRRLESDDSVYLAAIERLKASTAKALEQDDPEALGGEIADYADKYPRLAGLDRLQEDLREYLALNKALRSRQLGPLIDSMQKAHFATPPFQERLPQLEANGLPSPDVVQRYTAASNAWKSGQAGSAIGDLKSLASGPWADAVTAEIGHKQAVAAQFAALQKSRGGQGYEDRLLSFYESLDPAADVWFLNAIQGDVEALRQKVLARAAQWLNQAQAAWTQYRTNGAIGGEMRLETGMSEGFRKQAKLLADARSEAQHAVQIFHQLKAEGIAQADKLFAEITAEADLQRRSLLELSSVLEPAVLKAKLASINADQGVNGEERRAP
jgi:pSer/pThr/pTyr-binding forkhead associated (FHA) protein